MEEIQQNFTEGEKVILLESISASEFQFFPRYTEFIVLKKKKDRITFQTIDFCIKCKRQHVHEEFNPPYHSFAFSDWKHFSKFHHEPTTDGENFCYVKKYCNHCGNRFWEAE